MKRRYISLVLLLALGAAGPARAQDHAHHGNLAKLGKVDFPTSCRAEAQRHFVTGVAALHSFWFEQANQAFEQAAAADPGCAMAQWGVAMTLLGNPMARTAPTAERFERGRAAAENAKRLAASASHREQMYADAVVELYAMDAADHFERMRRHEAALEALVKAHPEDLEAAIFYGRAVVANAPPTDLEFTRQKYAATILNPLFARMPDHPGLAHYIIHAFDAPAIANLGLDAAKRYASIAPDAPHALHMPSHIFTRLGYWDESIETNARSAQAEPNPDAAVHPMDYMVYAYLQQGRDREAAAVVTRARELSDRFYGGILGYNFAAMRARYALERGKWAEAAALPVPAQAPPFVEAIPRFARAIGAARMQPANVELASAEVARLAELEATLKNANDTYWSTIVGAQRLAAAAWLAHLQGDHAGALRLAGEAANLEETVEKHPVTPGPLLPARELYGDILMVHGKPAEALAAYEATLKREPRRARALAGAAAAAAKAGRQDLAAKYDAELRELWGKAELDREDARVGAR